MSFELAGYEEQSSGDWRAAENRGRRHDADLRGLQRRKLSLAARFSRSISAWASATKIDSVEIQWPSGTVDKITNLAADKFYAVLEGSGIVDREKIVPKKK